MSSKLIWIDDEIELLKPHIQFLTSLGVTVDICDNSIHALEQIEAGTYDLVLLDENMPGLSGLEIVERIRTKDNPPKTVIISKNQDSAFIQSVMKTKVDDYLIKPVRFAELEILINKILHREELQVKQFQETFSQKHQQFQSKIFQAQDFQEIAIIYKELILFESSLNDISSEESFEGIIEQLKIDLNNVFFRLVEKDYAAWVSSTKNTEEAPDMLHRQFPDFILPHVQNNSNPCLILVMDNMRMDQYYLLKKELLKFYQLADEKYICGILPSTTEFARNALFSGLTPLKTAKAYPELWANNKETFKNKNEEELLHKLLERKGLELKFSFIKTSKSSELKQVKQKLKSLLHKNFGVLIVNSLDHISHEIDSELMKNEILDSEKKYRAFTEQWFKNSDLRSLLKKCSQIGMDLILLTDHGSHQVTKPNEIKGDQSLNSNARYKIGKSISYKRKTNAIFESPSSIEIPSASQNDKILFAAPQTYYHYENRKSDYKNRIQNTFQHGGISVEELIVIRSLFKAKKN